MDDLVTYLDHAASSQMNIEIKERLVNYLSNTTLGNGSSKHKIGRKIRQDIEESRSKIAEYLNCSPSQLFFTSGATESNNQIIYSALQDELVSEQLTSKIEHKSILIPAYHYSSLFDKPISFLHIGQSGEVQLENRASSTRGNKGLVSLTHVNNITGLQVSIDHLKEYKLNNNCLLHVDFTQSMLYHDFDLLNNEIDYATFSGHKIHAFSGIGVLFSRNGALGLKPLILGGGQERNCRAGTENILGIMSLSFAIDLLSERKEKLIQHARKMKRMFVRKMESDFPQIKILYDAGDNINSSIIPLLMPSYFQGLSQFFLDFNNLCVSSGSACSIDDEDSALGILELDGSRYIRVCVSTETTQEDIENFVSCMNGQTINLSL